MLCVHAAAKGRLCCAAVVAASVAVGAGSQASAASYYYWNNSETSIYRPEPPFLPRRQKPRHTQDKAAKPVQKESAKPQGPLIIAVSINKQQLKVYDANGLFAQAPVSTGMKGHPTPLGVFSVIQKQKFHRSNIYSNAPMPFMQRITWSGVALHAGVLPGYPASHGCIRMPPSFAVRMYGLTRMGSRVLVTPGEVAPSPFTHPLLAALKGPTEPAVSAQPDSNAPPAAKSDKRVELTTPVRGANLELRATIGHGDHEKELAEASPTSLREQTQTADASTPARGPIFDAPSSNVAPAEPEATSQTNANDTAADVPTKPAVSAPKADSTDGGTKPVDGAVKTDAAPSDAAKSDPATAAGTIAEKPVAPATSVPNAGASKPADLTTSDKPAGAGDANKDQTRLSTGDKAAAPVMPELKHNSPVAMFISRKDGKLYVRQNFAPVFSVPVTIAQNDRPLGTHLFTASADKTDASVMHWSVISLPTRNAARSAEGDKLSRRGRKDGDIEVPAAALVPDSAAEALDRITIPADVMAWLGGALSSGSSLIVSDQGIRQGETGEGTDFILSLR